VQRSYDRLVFLHGFLGSPQDWDGVLQHLPEYDCHALSYPFQIPPDVIVIGYSMGGRIALRCPHPKILLSTHPGLQTAQEKAERQEQDERWKKRFLQEPLDRLLEEWYAQPLFASLRKHPEFPRILRRRQEQNRLILAKMLDHESLAQQQFTIPSNAIFLHGELDAKYAQLYQDLKIPSLQIPQAGHAAHLENPEGCAEMIKKGLLAQPGGVSMLGSDVR
jgi:2-succinyl-6-hydroxy-2,4-cyclohexadiene-1-carboxylate synthase